MRPERWTEIEQHLFSVLSLTPAERSDYLRRACADDTDARRLIEELLAVESAAEGFLETPAAEVAHDSEALSESSSTVAAALGSPAADRIGPYRILRELGRGGMGRVLLAQRDDDAYERQVAIKVIDRHLDGPEIHRRFLAERQILAGLNHPGIAQLYEGGTLAEDRPYFIMEPVFGLPIDSYCEEHRLDLTARLDLFQRVCAAVHYAHQNLVVHRDLKPSNILVTPDGVPKLLDFGIAKVLAPGPDRQATDLTCTSMRVMTPSYASPEQVRGEAVTTASDVYSLGVLLYRLLTGEPPFRFDNASTEAIERVWLEQRPARPSTVLGRRAADLDNIVFKALRLEPQRRYLSADQLAEDLRRFQAGHPVSAREDTYSYRARKFLRRNRWAVAGVVGLLIVVFGFVWFRFDHMRQVARAEHQATHQLAEFMISLFEDSGDASPRSNKLTAHEVLERGEQQIRTRYQGQPEVRATLLEALGRAYYGLVEAQPAIDRLEEALAIRQQELGQDDHPASASVRHHLAWAFFCDGRFESSASLFRQTLAQRQRLHGDDSLEVAETSLGLARVLSALGETRQARDFARRALELRTGHLGPEHADTLGALNQVATLASELYALDEAEALYRRAVAAASQQRGTAVELARAWTGLGTVLMRQDKLDEAQTALDQGQAMRRQLHGEISPYYANSLGMQVGLAWRRNDFARAEHLQRRYNEILLELGGPSHPYLYEGQAILARILYDRGARADAEALFRRTIPLGAQAFGADNPKVARWQTWLAELLQARGHLAEARQLLGTAHASLLAAFGPEHPDVVETRAQLDRVLADLQTIS
ncbi:MAG: tetratricopeptide repeat protein [Acidobacteriota bacterium]